MQFKEEEEEEEGLLTTAHHPDERLCFRGLIPLRGQSTVSKVEQADQSPG